MRRTQRGAALLETIITMPILLLFAFGVVEYGTLALDKMGMQTAARFASRTAGSLGTQPKIDYYILKSVKNSAASIKNAQLTDLLVFNPDASGKPTAACKATIGTASPGIMGQCNHYVLPGAYAIAPARFTNNLPAPPPPTASDNTCTAAAVDRYFCPHVRINSYAGAGPQKIGVLIVGRHKSVTQLVFKTMQVKDQLVVQLDPDTRMG